MNEHARLATLAASFAAGLLSFASPCVLPIVPSFLGFISGMSLEEMSGEAAERAAALYYTAWFVAGFSLVFVALGATATAVGGLLLEHQAALRVAGGAFIVALGLQFMGAFQVGFLQLDRRLHLKAKPAGALGSFLVGVTFALGWTPCIGPMLSSVLFMAASSDTVARGVALLAAYAAGFAVPFLAAAAALGLFLRTYRRFSRYVPKVVFASGALLVVIGVMLMADWFAAAAEFLTAWLTP